MYSIIVAKAKNNVIGRNNDLPWHIPEDLKYFKSKTKGHKVILGMKNYESIGHILKGRENIILSRENVKIEGAKVYTDFEKLVEDYKDFEEEIFVVGGAQIYKLFLDANLVDKMYITQLDQDVEGDIIFPEFDKSKWKLTNSKKSSNDKFEYDFQVWEKRGLEN